MEDSLGECQRLRNEVERWVLILVVVEDSLGEVVEDNFEARENSCLNPCCCGR